MAKSEAKSNRIGKERYCPLVAMGASAGGIQALKLFFEALPKDSGAAYVVVLHLSPSHESHLVSVLRRSTEIDVVQVDRPAEIRPNCVYVIKPDSVLTLSEGHLRARKPKTAFERRHPVDAIFISLAEHRAAEAICIVFSGSGSNGSAGALAVRERDGLVLVQDPDTAEHPEMPRNIVAAGLADRALPPGELPAALMGYLRDALPLLESAGAGLTQSADMQLSDILSVLRKRSRYDFTPYKSSTLLRRIVRRMGLCQLDSMAAYAERLGSDDEETQSLVNDLLINVTGFFCDAEAWEALQQKVIQPLVESSDSGQLVRVWTPACSSGEEAYSIAIMLLEQAELAGKRLDIKIFATDAAPNSLARARTGIFPASIAETLSPQRLKRFFLQEDDVYKAKTELREVVVFAPQNLLADPPFSRLDLVTCRNLLIYLTPEIQDKVIALLHFSLREDGCLFLGSAETIGRHHDLFKAVSKKWRIYRRIGDTRHDLVEFPLLGSNYSGASFLETRNGRRRPLTEEAREVLLSVFVPSSVLIDEQFRVLYFHGEVGNYLKVPSGEPTLDLLAMAGEELRPKLRAAIRKAGRESSPVVTDVAAGGDGSGRIRVKVVPTTMQRFTGRYLVSFEDMAPSAARTVKKSRRLGEGLPEKQLEADLRTAREELRLSVEQLEVSNEELKASNEEVTSMNEELQSTNEELETSKEELQSLNEELNTVNTQLQSKLEQLEDRTNDLNNLLNSTDIATLFLDRQLSIRWFSPPVRKLFQVIQTDIGRPIEDFARRFDDEDFLLEAIEVLKTLQSKEKEVQGEDGRWHLRRIVPYRTEDNRIDGIVATFTDISQRKAYEEALAVAKAFAERIVDTTRQPLVVLSESFQLRSANRAFYRTFNLSPEQVEGRVFFEMDGGDWNITELRRLLKKPFPTDGILNDVVLTHVFRKLGRRHLQVNARRLDDDDFLLLAIEDVTARRDEEANREILLAELQHRVRNLLSRVLALVSLSEEDNDGTKVFIRRLRGRLLAMARAEEVIGRRRQNISLKQLVEAELAEFGDAAIDLEAEGANILLPSGQAQNIALVFHELATNAAKYGALSKPGGHLRVDWAVARGKDGETLTLHWKESGAAKPSKGEKGFGTKLMIDIVPKMLGGSASLHFGKDGIDYSLTMPLSLEQEEPDSAS